MSEGGRAVAGPDVPLVAVVGPTATGKSDLGVAIAARLGGEVVNADAFQLYRGMDIGTAKLTPPERQGVPHHQLDVLDVSDEASVARYQAEARADVARIAEAGARAVVVGGSGLYVRALLDEMEFPGTDPHIRSALEERANREGTAALHAELAAMDPAAALAIEPNNTRRIVRALEVIELTGRPFTATLPTQRYVRPAVQIGLDCDPGELDRRVEVRVERMWDAGLVEEVLALAPQMGRTAARAVGYAEVLAAVRGDLSLDEAREAVVANTRRLARRQMRWFGRDGRVHWLDSGAQDLVDQALGLVAAANAGNLGDPQAVRRRLGG